MDVAGALDTQNNQLCGAEAGGCAGPASSPSPTMEHDVVCALNQFQGGNIVGGGPLVWESRLPQKMGVPRELIRVARAKCAENVHWKWQGNRVVWTPAGISRLVELVCEASNAKKLARGASEHVRAGLEQPRRSLEVVQLVVAKIVANPRMVLATDGKKMYRVKVASNAHFVPRMTIPVRIVRDDVAELARPCPRQKGRW